MTAAILATILFSLSAVSGKRLSHHLSGVEANFWRFLLAAALLGIYAHSMGAGLGRRGAGRVFHQWHRWVRRGGLRLVPGFPDPWFAADDGDDTMPRRALCGVDRVALAGRGLSLGQVLAGTAILVGVALALAPSETSQVDKKHWKAGIMWGLMSAFGQGFGAVLSRKAVSVVEAGQVQIRNRGRAVPGVSAQSLVA